MTQIIAPTVICMKMRNRSTVSFAIDPIAPIQNYLKTIRHVIDLKKHLHNQVGGAP